MERLPPEIIERILTMAMRGSNHNRNSHVLQSYNSYEMYVNFGEE